MQNVASGSLADVLRILAKKPVPTAVDEENVTNMICPELSITVMF